MDFYTLLSKHYEEIFPLSDACTAFIRQRVLPGQRFLDAGCSTGSLVRTLRSSGIDALGFDLDESMIRLARKYIEKTASIPGEVFRSGNLIHINEMYDPGSFDCLACLGNTLIHIPFNLQFQFLNDSVNLIKTGGKLILQILNYSNILHDGLEFPELETEHFIFKRNYEPGPAEGMLYFNTLLIEKKSGHEYSNSIIHYPLLPEILMASLSMSGFKEWMTYGSYMSDPAGSGQLPLIIEAHV